MASLFKMETSLKGTKLPPEEVNSYLLRAVPCGIEITFTTLGDLP